MDGVAVAPEFQATANGGHTFQNTGTDTGMFLNSNNEPEFRINNSPKAVVRNNPSLMANDNTLVTMAMLQEFKASLMTTQFPIGISIITQDPRNPAEYLGFGSWERDLQGKALVGVTTDITSASPDWTKTVNKEYGVYDNNLTIPYTGWSVKEGPYLDTPSQKGVLVAGSGNVEISENVESLAHINASQTILQNNVFPSKTKFIWTRVG